VDIAEIRRGRLHLLSWKARVSRTGNRGGKLPLRGNEVEFVDIVRKVSKKKWIQIWVRERLRQGASEPGV